MTLWLSFKLRISNVAVWSAELGRPERPIKAGISYYYCCPNAALNYPQAAHLNKSLQLMSKPPPPVFPQFLPWLSGSMGIKGAGHRQTQQRVLGSPFRHSWNPCVYLSSRDKRRWLFSHQSHHTQCLFSQRLNQTLLIYFPFFTSELANPRNDGGCHNTEHQSLSFSQTHTHFSVCILTSLLPQCEL